MSVIENAKEEKSNNSNDEEDKSEQRRRQTISLLEAKASNLEQINEKEESELSESHESSDDLSDLDEYIKLKDELNKGLNFIDYFLTIGVEPKIFLQDWLYKSDLEELNKNHENELKPKITSSFPPFEKSTIAFDESVIMHAFPNGFKIIQSKNKPSVQIFSFILDNNYFNLNYPQKFLTCLVTYENLSQYWKLHYQYKKLSIEELELSKAISKSNTISNSLSSDLDFLSNKKSTSSNLTRNTTEISSRSASVYYDSDIYIPKCLMVMSLYPFFSEYERILLSLYNYSLGSVDYNSNLSEAENKKDVRSSMILNKTSLPIDKFIENFLLEIPVPPRGETNIQYTLINEKREIKQSLMNQLPLIDINLKKLFQKFKIKEIVDIYHHLFLESRVLFFSEQIDILNIFIYGLLSLLYPFQYQYQVVTILPEENFEILESITPFIAGINLKYTKDFFESRDLTLSDSILIVDIDERTLEIVNEMSPIPDFPKNYRKILEKHLSNVVSKRMKDDLKKINNLIKNKKSVDNVSKKEENSNLNSSIMNINMNDQSFTTTNTMMTFNSVDTVLVNNMNNVENVDYENDPCGNLHISYEFNKEVSEIFFNFNAKLLSNYSGFLNLDFYSSNNQPCLELLFKVDDYLKSVPVNEKDFYDKFISETQLFGDFLYKRMVPKSSAEKIQILAFDEKINENSKGFFKKSFPSVFTHSKDYAFKDIFMVQKPRELTEFEINYYNNPNNQKQLLSSGIIIDKDKNTNKIIFRYPVFPKLLTKIFFKENLKEYFITTNLNDNLESINGDLISKSHLGSVSVRQNDMQNYISLCWIQMWAMTFWYCDDVEKKYRFQELVKILEKTSSHEMETFNLLFEALQKYGDDYMILKAYSVLLKLRLNPSYKVHDIVMKILDKNNQTGCGNIQEVLKKLLVKEENIVYNNKNFRKRTFKSKYYNHILNDRIIFFAFETCIECQTIVNLELASKNLKEMIRDINWIKCPECGNYILPKISIQFGEEYNKIGKFKFNTCLYDSVVLFSPYYLKNNFHNSLVKDFGVELNVEELLAKYNNIFWNSLWYFKLYNLEYDFMLPYLKKCESPIINSAINIETTSTFLINEKKNEKAKKEEEEEDDSKFSADELKIVKKQIDFLIKGAGKG